MSRAVIIIRDHITRTKALKLVYAAKFGTIIESREPQRTPEQNSRMWAMLTDVAAQLEHCDHKYNTDEWKVIFLHAFGRQVKFLPSLDGASFVPYGQSSSQLGKTEMSKFIEFIAAEGAQRGVVFHDDIQAA